ncbi:MAG: WD repeat-containing protein jip5 [Alectoria fallacina]|uniref:WD repeat-containing protein JIP5 n=1 Tax=Alectoria fallacina TaxID=1903189 RepID=A0A8H3EEY1_9LECA|nr:MAG: WD repeat-containing protein jip5 [Alectoria fallacina]
MFNSICTYPIRSDLFAQAIHPASPLLALGLASGHVQLQRLPSSDPTEARNSTIETAWRTRRHRGSCRSLCFDHDGEHLFSAGTDGIVKVAATETGQVASKIAVPLHKYIYTPTPAEALSMEFAELFLWLGNNSDSIDPPSVLHAPTPKTLLLSTDSSALYLYDLRANSTFTSSKPQQTHHPHDDYVSSITPLPPTGNSKSGFCKQWATTGGSTIAILDIRQGVLIKSEDQGEEILSSCVVDGKLVVGSEKGALRIWQVGSWDDNEQTVAVVGKGASADVLAAVGENQMVAVGLDDGCVRFVDLSRKKPKVLHETEVRHDEVESVLGLGFEVEGRMISGGGQVVKVWEDNYGADDEEDEEDEDIRAMNNKRVNGFGSDEDGSENGVDESSEEEQRQRKRKKRKRNKSKNQSGGQQHVVAFKGMD